MHDYMDVGVRVMQDARTEEQLSRAPSGTSAENMYLQYFVGLKVFQSKAVFVPSLFVEIRKRMGEQVFEVFEQSIIDVLYPQTEMNKKPRSYRQKARKAYLAIVKCRRPGKKKYHQGNKQQLQYLRRNLNSIENLLYSLPGRAIPLPPRLLRQYWSIRHLYAQQDDMYKNKTHRCDDRLVSISQPHVRPIIRGKQNKPVEFGAKLSVSLTRDEIGRAAWRERV